MTARDPVMTGATMSGEYTVKFDETGSAFVRGTGVTRDTQVHTLVNDLGISLAFGALLPPHLADLLDIAVAVYVADRLCPRRPRTGYRSHLDELWQRRMTVRVPLRDAIAWSPERRVKLETLLSFLTDDQWTLMFTGERPELRLSETQGSFLQDVPQGDVTSALLSGGLDSLAGIAAELTDHPDRTVVAFSARTNERIGVYQREQVRLLTDIFGSRIRHVPVTIKLRDRAHGEYDREEPSQRTRAFVFQIFGAVTAAVAGVRVLHVYENGVGALNLPYSSAQLGSQATRATHPLTVGIASDLLSDVIGESFLVSLPYLLSTKSEMCAVFHDPRLQSLILHAISCDKFPQRVAGKPQCGLCPSCLLSRQSLFSAGLRAVDDPTRFRHDIYSLNGPNAAEQKYDFRVMSGQASMIARHCRAAEPWSSLVRHYPLLFEAAHDNTIRGGGGLGAGIVSLYERYTSEWQQFRLAVSQNKARAA